MEGVEIANCVGEVGCDEVGQFYLSGDGIG
jgi:hypothetical protein